MPNRYSIPAAKIPKMIYCKNAWNRSILAQEQDTLYQQYIEYIHLKITR